MPKYVSTKSDLYLKGWFNTLFLLSTLIVFLGNGFQ